MATNEQLEIGLDTSRPVEVVRITVGSQVFRYSMGSKPITVGSETFLPEKALSRSKLRQGNDQQNQGVLLNFLASNDVVQKYVFIAPGQRGTAQIFRIQRDETPALTMVLIFTGIIQAVKFSQDGQFAELGLRSLEQALNQNIPRFTYMASCNNFLYDQFCQVDPALHNLTGTVVAVSGNSITVTGVGASSLKFLSGVVRPTVEVDFRQVIGVSGDVLTLDAPFSSNLLNAQVQVFAGCDHVLTGDCALVYDNVINFGGFAFVPLREIFSQGLETV